MITCLKFKINNGPYKVVSANNNDENIQELASGLNSDEDSLQLLGLLGNFFDLFPDDFWFSRQSIFNSQIHNPTQVVLIGRLVNSKTSSGHSANSLSLVTYNKKSLLESITKDRPPQYEGTLEQWKTTVANTPMSDLGSLLAVHKNNTMYNYTVFSDKKMTLTFAPMTQQDFDDFASESGYFFTPIDMLDTFKSKLGFKSNGLPLETQPISVKNIDGEEVIVIEADANITTNLANLPTYA